jgi:hypothetical protein
LAHWFTRPAAASVPLLAWNDVPLLEV